MKDKQIYLEITPFFPTEKSFRGPYIYDQVKAIERNSDYDVVVVKTVSMFSKEPETYTYNGVTVYNFKVIDFPSAILPGLFHTVNLHRFERFLKNIVGIIPQQIAFVHGHVAYPAGALAADFGKRHNIKSFIQHHGLDVMQLNNGRILYGFLKKFNNIFIEKRFFKTVNNCSLNIGVSQKVIEALCKLEKYKSNNNYVLYNGVDKRKFYKINKSKKSIKKFKIGCIANFWPLKDQMTLIKAISLLPNETKQKLHVVFIGSGPTLKQCLDFVIKNKLDQTIVFEKEIDHKRLNDFYNSLDLFILPSYYEAFGCVYTEALQCGIPIIAVKDQGIEEILSENHKHLFLIDKKDYKELSKRIQFFMTADVVINYNIDLDLLVNSFLKKVTKQRK